MNEQTAQSPLTVARIIALAFVSGVVAFWIVAWIVSKGGTAPKAPDGLPVTLVLAIWAPLALGGLAGALYLQRQAEAATGNAPVVNSKLIVAWALLEAPALFAGVALLMWGQRLPLFVNIPILIVGMAATFPRAEWFVEQNR